MKEHFRLSPSKTMLVLAVSGGIDSVVLANLAAKAGFEFIIVHCNFKLRGEESERDEVFVKSLQQKYNKEVLVKHFNTGQYASENKISIQEAARALRYKWFDELLNAISFDEKLNIEQRSKFVATAHHANDNIETLLINFFRGTGISGLHGIPSKQKKIIRPLLFAKRQEIAAYANQHSLQWVEDSSNLSEKYARNFFRLKLIPDVKKVYSNVEDNLLKNIERFSEAEILYRQAVDLHIKKLCRTQANEVHIPIGLLKKTTPLNTIIREIIKIFGFSASQVEEVKKLFEAENGKNIISATHRIIKNRNNLIIAPVAANEACHISIDDTEKKIVFGEKILQLQLMQEMPVSIPNQSDIALLDAKNISWPLLLRRWKTGDYFYPLGMQKKKKIPNFLSDLKLSKTEKEKIWILESNKKILWVMGYRIDDRFKIISSTKNFLCLKIDFA